MDKEHAEKAAIIAISLKDQVESIARDIIIKVLGWEDKEINTFTKTIIGPVSAVVCWAKYQCGETDYYDIEIPYSYFSSDYLEVEKAKKEKEIAEAKKASEERNAAQRQKQEDFERTMLKELKAKYEGGS